MATIQTAIQLTDRMTAPLMNITSALTTVIGEFERVQAVSGNAFNIEKISGASARLNIAEQQLNDISSASARAAASQSELNNKWAHGGGAVDGLLTKGKQLVATYASIQGAQKLINLSDSMSQTESRLNLIVDDGGSVDELEQKIMDSANRSRADYLTTASMVAGFAQRAGDAFSGNDEVVRFTETLNKMYVISGATQQEQASSMLQLTQALSSGVLRGEEFNAVFDASPNIMQAIADYMDVPIGKLRGMAADGEITANTVKNAIMGAAEQVNQDFEGMQMTWGQMWTLFKNDAVEKMEPILQKISQIANSDGFQSFATSAVNVLGILVDAVLVIFDLIGSVGSFVVDNWSIIEPIIWGIVAALIVYNATMGIGWLTTLKDISAKGAHAIASGAQTAAIIAMTFAQEGLNAALALCPLTWIIIAIFAVISVIYAVVAAINKVTGKTTSATGVIFGCIAWLGAAILNRVIGVINAIIQLVWSTFVEPFIGIIEWVLNVANGGFDSFGGAVANLIGQIISWFLSLGKIVTKIIDAIFGTDWTSGLTSLQDSVTSWGKNDNAISISREAPAINRIAYGDAWNAGYGLGESLGNKVSGFFDFGGGLGDGLDKGKYSQDAYKNAEIQNASLTNAANQTASNTADISDKLDTTSDQLKYIREYAEKEAINRFTTSNININMTNNNNMSSDADVDGIMNSLKNKLQSQMNISAEGV